MSLSLLVCSFVCLSVCLSFLSFCLCEYLSFFSICLFLFPSICSVCLSFCQSIHFSRHFHVYKVITFWRKIATRLLVISWSIVKVNVMSLKSINKTVPIKNRLFKDIRIYCKITLNLYGSQLDNMLLISEKDRWSLSWNFSKSVFYI